MASRGRTVGRGGGRGKRVATPAVAALAGLPAGVELLSAINGLDLSSLTGFDLPLVLRAVYRLGNHTRALLLDVVAETMRRKDPDGTRAGDWDAVAVHEVRTALTMSRTAANSLNHLAQDLYERLPRVLDAMRAGLLDQPRARVFSSWTGWLSDEHARAIVDALLPAAPKLTTGELIDEIRRVAIELDPDFAKRQHDHGRSQRQVRGSISHDGTGQISAEGLSAEQVAAACDRLDAIGWHLKRAGHPDKLDHIRADVFAGLLTGQYAGLTDEELLEKLLADLPPTPAPDPAPKPSSTSQPQPTPTHPGGREPGGTGDEEEPAPGEQRDAGAGGDDLPDAYEPARRGDDETGADLDCDGGQPGGDAAGAGDLGEQPAGPGARRPARDAASGEQCPPAGHGGDTRKHRDRTDMDLADTTGSDRPSPEDPSTEDQAGDRAAGAPAGGNWAGDDPSDEEPSDEEPPPEDQPPKDDPGGGPGPVDIGPRGPAGGAATPATQRRGAPPGRGPDPPGAGGGDEGGGMRLHRRGLRLWAGLGTIAGRDRRPGELLGWGLLHAEAARQVAAAPTASWWYALVDGQDRPLHAGPVRRRPTAPCCEGDPFDVDGVQVWLQLTAEELADLVAHPPLGWDRIIDDMHHRVANSPAGVPNGDPADRFPGHGLRRYLAMRDRRCLFPTCRIPSHRCQVDHTVDHALGGPTIESNLANVCAGDHALKTNHGWQARQITAGHLIWTSPLGHEYEKCPPRGPSYAQPPMADPAGPAHDWFRRPTDDEVEEWFDVHPTHARTGFVDRSWLDRTLGYDGRPDPNAPPRPKPEPKPTREPKPRPAPLARRPEDDSIPF